MGATSGHGISHTIINRTLAVLVESRNLVGEGSQLTETGLSELFRNRYGGVFRDVARDNALFVVLYTWTGFLHVGISTVYTSHLEVTVSGLQEFVWVLDLLLWLPLLLFANLA